MRHPGVPSLLARITHQLPPSTPVPATVQTLACRGMPLRYFELCRARYGARFTVYPLDMSPMVFLSDPEEVRELLSAPAHILDPGSGANVLAPLVGESSFMLQAQETHLSGRRAIMPALRRAAAGEHASMVAEVAEREIGSWPLDRPFAVHPRLRSLSLQVIMRVVFANDWAELEVLHARLLEMLGMTRSFLLTEPRLRHLPGWHGVWSRFTGQRREVDQLIGALISQARHTGPGRGATMLELLLAAHNRDGSRLSDRQVRDQLMSVILAGHETTASELAWAFQLLAHHRPAQERLAREIDRGEEAYLTATVQEVLRHRPVFLFAIPRVVIEPIELGGWRYRPPAHLLGCIYLVHHDPALYRDPQEFRPERFLHGPPPAGSWLPWGGGRKRCPGEHLALLEMHTVLRATLAKWAITPAGTRPEHASWRSVIVTPHAGARIVLRKRRPPMEAAGHG